jgi:hypothetical protein
MQDIALSNSLGVAMVVTYLVQRMKTSGLRVFNSISSENPQLVRVVAAVGAILTAAGFTWDYTAEGGVLTITGITIANVAGFVWLAVKQWIFQESFYSLGKAAKRGHIIGE